MLFDGDVFDDILLRLLFGVGDDGHDGVFACRESRVGVFGLPVVDVPVDPADLAAVVEQTQHDRRVVRVSLIRDADAYAFIGVGRLRIEDQVFAAVHRVGHLCDGECIFGGGRQTRYVEGIASRYGLRTLYVCRFPCDLPLGGRIALPCQQGVVLSGADLGLEIGLGLDRQPDLRTVEFYIAERNGRFAAVP